MKIVWVSPFGWGWSVVDKLREAGHKVVYVSPSRNGDGFLPRLAPEEAWQSYAKKADVTLVDATPASRRTRRSYDPSDLSFELSRLRHFGSPIIGPTPTAELIQNDPRYFRKTLRRFGLHGVPAVGTDTNQHRPQSLFVTLGPFGQASATVRSEDFDAVIPLSVRDGLVQKCLGGLQGFLSETHFTSYVNAELVFVADDFYVARLLVEPLYPAGFHMLGDLLGTGLLASYPDADQPGDQEPPRSLGLAVVLNRLQEDPGSPRNIPLDLPGFFGAELHAAEGQEPKVAEPHGLVLGALVGNDLRWGELTRKVQLEAERVAPQIGGRTPVLGGLDDVPKLIEDLRHRGFLSHGLV